MRRRFIPFAMFCCMAMLASAQEHPPQQPAGEASHGGGHDSAPGVMWKWANFAILAAGLGYLGAKHGGPFFRARTEEIRKGIADAAAQKQAADARVAEIERRLNDLDLKIAELRAGAKEEMNAESERIRLETARSLAKVHTQAEQEIASLAKTARHALKEYSALLAIELAERRIRDRVTPQVQQELVTAFANSLPSEGIR